MSDNTPVLDPDWPHNTRSGDVIATDEISDGGAADGVKVQRIKAGFGADAAYTDVEASNPLPAGGGFVSINNSTTTLLTGGATYQGTADDVTGFTTASVSIYGSLNTATGTLFFEASSDNVVFTNIKRIVPELNFDIPHMWLIAEKFFRIRYENDSVAQTGSFRIQTMYSNARTMNLANTLEGTVGLTNLVTLTREINPADLGLARKLVTGQRAFFFFGFNAVVGTSWEDVWAGGGDINWQTTAAKVKIASSDAADNGTTPGLGVQSVEIHGLSATGVDQDEVILTNGTTAVESALTYIRVNKMHSETCGTYGGSHQGDIECRVTNATFANGALLAKMTGVEGNVDTAVVYGSGEAGNGFWSVPLTKVLYITRLEVIADVATNKTVDIALYEREDILDVTTPYAPRRVLWQESGVSEANIEKEFKSHIKIKALADIWFRAKGSANTKIEVSLDFYLLDGNASGA